MVRSRAPACAWVRTFQRWHGSQKDGGRSAIQDRIYDAAIAGAGPAGSRMARELARSGLNVVVLEEHSAVGTPCHCSGLISPRTLELAEVGNEVVINTIRGAVVHVPDAPPTRVAGDRVHAYVVDRIELDRRLAGQAEMAGASFMRETRLVGFSVAGDTGRSERGEVVARVVREGVETTVRARMLVGADGARSRVAQQVRGGSPLRNAVVGLGAIAEYDRNPLPDHVELFLDADAAPGWFGWTIPLDERTARLGTGSANGIKPRESFRRLQRRFPDSFGAAHVRRYTGGLIAVWQPTALVEDRVVLVGDAARQVKPTSGGGIHAALRAAHLAADATATAIRRNDLSRRSLAAYARRWERSVGRELRRQSDMRRAFERLSAKDLVNLIDLIADAEVRGAIDHAADIDFPSRLVAAVGVREPRLAIKLLQWPRYPLAWLTGS